jgi:hypothetical protein
VCFGIRVMALSRGWQLPTAGGAKNAVESARNEGGRRDPP